VREVVHEALGVGKHGVAGRATGYGLGLRATGYRPYGMTGSQSR
jgi:hypothetical protein